MDLSFTKVLIFFSQKCVKLFPLPVDVDKKSCILKDTARNCITGRYPRFSKNLADENANLKISQVCSSTRQGELKICD
jgi:hypothetical protein